MQSTFPIQLGATQDPGEFARTRAGRISLAISATAFVAICAHVSIPLYFTPVPVTLQTLAVILIGLALGPAAGFSAMLLYLAEGAMGLPVFSPHGPGGVAQLLGPTAGYLFSYPLAAAAAGSLVRAVRLGRSQFPAALFAGFAASVIILSTGAGWIALLLHLTPGAAWHMAIAPFLPGEVLKVTAAAGVFTALRRWHRS
ncbi:MAG: biotin transporter BioY [Acidobacteriaceae bacterium]|jgi:biotin transport system substrate-specific component